MDLPSHASSHGFGAAMTDDDTNEEPAPATDTQEEWDARMEEMSRKDKEER